jgi:DNA-binding transcriptional regulator GbsR (MarR family)
MENMQNANGERVEKLGKTLEKFGLTPMQGRIVAFFVISDPPEKTFEETVRYFSASKSSVSNSLNYLLSAGLVDYRTYADKRKRFFFVTDEFIRVYFRDVLTNVAELREMIYKIVTVRSPDFPEATEKILRWIENSNIFEQAVEKTLSETDKGDYV